MNKDEGNVVPMKRESTHRDDRESAPRFFPEAQGHEKILAGCKKNRKDMHLEMMDGTHMTGQITQFDRWTITLRDEGGYMQTVFKHAIKYFTGV